MTVPELPVSESTCSRSQPALSLGSVALANWLLKSWMDGCGSGKNGRPGWKNSFHEHCASWLFKYEQLHLRSSHLCWVLAALANEANTLLGSTEISCDCNRLSVHVDKMENWSTTLQWELNKWSIVNLTTFWGIQTWGLCFNVIYWKFTVRSSSKFLCS